VANTVQLSGQGVTTQLPATWEGRIILPSDGGTFAMHAASFALPAGDGEWPGFAVSAMPSGGAILALVEQDPSFAGLGAYEPGAIPQNLTLDDFSWGAMPNPQPGRVAVQYFFTVPTTRTWACWIVLDRNSGSDADRLAGINGVLQSLRIVDPQG
jgi:hypothetical protein